MEGIHVEKKRVEKKMDRLLMGEGELFLKVWRDVLKADVRAALGLRRVSICLHDLIESVLSEADNLRWKWNEALTLKQIISNEGRTLVSFGRCEDEILPWASGCLMSTTGVSCFTVRIDMSNYDGNGIQVGVCDAPALCSWAMTLFAGEIVRETRNLNGELETPPSLPPENCPDGNRTQVLKDSEGRPAHLRDRANGVLIQVVFDHDSGELSYGVEDEPLVVGLRGFPSAIQLRPFVMLEMWGDQVTLLPPTHIDSKNRVNPHAKNQLESAHYEPRCNAGIR